MAKPITIASLADAKQARRELSTVTDATSKSTKRMESFHKVGRVAGAAFVGGLALAGKAAVDFTKKAAQDQQSAARLAQTLTKAAGATKGQVAATEAWISAQEKAKGVSDEELRPALAKLVVATGSVGKAQKLASLAMDVSQGTGKSLASVSFALAKAQNGNVTGLARLGVQTTKTTMEQGKAVKTTLSLHDITQNLADTYGGAASANAQTAAGKAQILSVQMQELQEKIGAGLLPVMQKLVDVGLKVVDFISRNSAVIGPLVAVVLTLAGAVWAVTAATTAWNAVLALNPIGIVVIAIAALVVGLVILYKKSETARKIMQFAFEGIKLAVAVLWAVVKPIFKGWIVEIQAVGAVAKWLWNNAFQPALQFIVRGIGFLMDLWAKMLHALSHIPGFGWADAAGDAMQRAADKARNLANAIQDIPNSKSVDVVVNIVQGVIHTTGGRVPTDPGQPRTGGGGGSSTGGSSRSSSSSRSAPQSVTINVTAPVGSDPYTIGEQIRYYLNEFEAAS